MQIHGHDPAQHDGIFFQPMPEKNEINISDSDNVRRFAFDFRLLKIRNAQSLDSASLVPRFNMNILADVMNQNRVINHVTCG